MSEASSDSRHLRLILEYGAARSSFRWKQQGEPYDRLPSLEDFVSLAVRAEESGFDAVFFADFIGLDRRTVGGRATIPFEPLTLLAAVAARTKRIGLVATASTTFSYPYSVARQFASLDHLSAGRAGWNIVTSFRGEENFGLPSLPEPEERYAMAQEFLDVTQALWSSWEQDATISDATNPAYVDPEKVHDVKFEGRWYRVEGALDLPTPVQGSPVLFQAGASGPGIAFAARNAEATFVASPSIEHARTYQERLREAEQEVGREPGSVLVLPGLRVVLAETDLEAEVLREAQLAQVSLEALRATVEAEFEGLDLSGIEWNEPIPEGRFPSAAQIAEFSRRRSRAELYREAAFRPGVTLERFLRGVQRSGGHLTLVGSPVTVAAQIEHWFSSGVVDGFLLGESIGIDLFFDGVVPELVRRGLIRDEETTTTLRGRLGLNR